MTAPDFGGYRALILGDPTCSVGTSAVAAAISNAPIWSAQVDGNVVINGTDPVYHASSGGGQLTDKSVAFAVDAPGKTGAYISLSCYYHGVASGTPIPLLDHLSSEPTDFTARGVGCFNDAHIVATHPALAGLTDASLSNWSCSVHEAFNSWPEDFTVLAIAKGIGGSYTGADGSVGTPYIVARGEGLSASDISLTPGTASVPLPGSHSVSALVATGGTPVAGKTVTFTVESGPNTGTTGSAVTGADGKAGFSYTGTTGGTDAIRASFVDGRGVTQQSNLATVEWLGPANAAPTADTSDATVAEGDTVTLTGTGTDADGDALVYEWDLDGNGTFETAGASPLFSAVGKDGPSTQPVVLRVCDTSGDCDDDRAVVSITNVAPTASAGADITVFRNSTAPLSGSFSDPAGSLDAPFGWTWSGSSGTAAYGDALSSSPTFPTAGSYDLELAVTDEDGATGTDSVTVTVLNQPPDCTRATASKGPIWPPNHQMVDVSVLGVTDAEADPLQITVTSIHQDERVRSLGSGSTSPDGSGVGTSTAQVRAERDGSPKQPGNGRVYHIGFSADDGHGGACSGTVTVGVPHDQRGGPAVDGGPLYDSTV